MKTVYVLAIALIAGIILPAVVVGTISSKEDARPPSGAETKSVVRELPVNVPTAINGDLWNNDVPRLLALRHELKLSSEQVQLLGRIGYESREKAVAVLTPAQQKTLAKMPGQPMQQGQAYGKLFEALMQTHEGTGTRIQEQGQSPSK